MLLSICQNTFQSLVELEAVDALRVEVRECYAEITKTSEQIQSTVRENYLSKDDLTTIQQDWQETFPRCCPSAGPPHVDWYERSHRAPARRDCSSR